MDEWLVIGGLLFLYFLSGPILGGVALGKISGLREQIEDLRRDLQRVSAGLRRSEAAAPQEAPEPPPEPELPLEPEAEPLPQGVMPPREPVPTAAPPEEPAEPKTPPRPAIAARAAAPKPALEQRLTSRWMVWLGAITLALGGAFLVKFTIDQGLLGPTARVVLGVLLGSVLTVGGEWLRRRPLERAFAAVGPSHVPPALTAAGIFTLFASLYSAYALYGLIIPVVAFVLLGLVATGAVALSLLQGPFIAALGLLGGFATPMLVSTNNPSALALFSYLLFLVGGSLAVARYKNWRWLDGLAIAGSVAWVLIWYGGGWQRADTPVLGGFLLLLMAATITAHHGITRLASEGGPQIRKWQDLWQLDRIGTACAAAVAVLIFMLVRLERYGPVSLTVLAAFVTYLLYNGRRVAGLIALPAIGGLLTAATLALWHLPQIVTKRAYLIPAQGEALGFAPGQVLPPELETFAAVSVIFALLFGIGGFLLLWRAQRPGYWAILATSLPVTILITAYWRIEAFDVGLAWTLISLGLAGAFLAAASFLVQQEHKRGLDPDLLRGALGAFAIAVVTATTLAATTQLREAWLTVALALQLPAMAWINGYLNLSYIRKAAVLLAGTVLVRLVFNQGILGYTPIETPIFNWLLYGYGIPSVAFLGAAHLFRQKKDDLLVMLLEAGALVFGVLLVTLEIRQLFSGGYLGDVSYTLAEQATHNLAWLAMAFGLLRMNGQHPRPVLLWGWRVLGGWAAVHLVLGACLLSNPLFNSVHVGEWHVINMLALSYGAPALLAVLFARELRKQGYDLIAIGAGVLALLLVFVNLTLEIRHGFQGPYLSRGSTSDAEQYAYSLGWLLYAGLLLGAALFTRHAALRYASLAIILVTIGKVFLFDMAALEGLYRALSFLGLGGSLVGIGYLYQRFVFPPARPPADGEDRAGTAEAKEA